MSIYSTFQRVGPKLVSKFANTNEISLQRKTNVADGIGGNTVTWSTVATFSGAVIPLSGNESYQHGRLIERVTHAVYSSYSDGSSVAVGDRLSFRGRVLDVRWIENIAESDAAFKFLCEEGAGS